MDPYQGFVCRYLWDNQYKLLLVIAQDASMQTAYSLKKPFSYERIDVFERSAAPG